MMELTVAECGAARADEALAFAKRVFDEFEAPDYAPLGRETFLCTAINSPVFREGIARGENRLFCALDGARLIGTCVTRGKAHISLIFVEKEYHNRGVGRALLEFALSKMCESGTLRVTVNSSPRAVGFYRTLGFSAKGGEQTRDGITFTPMSRLYSASDAELWDVRDDNCELTGRLARRDSYRTLGDGEYMLAVHVFIYTPDGRFLIQKRSPCKAILPGVWDVTAGAAIAGETGMQAAARETKEEVGLILAPENMYLASRLKHRHSFVELWFARCDFRESDCALQEGEVDEIMLVSAKNLIRRIAAARHRGFAYKSAAIHAVKSVKLG